MPRFDNATTDHTNWNFNNYHVQSELTSGEFMSSDSLLVAAGPPQLDMIAQDLDADGTAAEIDSGLVFPIGVLEQFSMGQSQQLQPVFEIGSSRAYFIPGKNVGTLQLGRVLFSGPSLLKVLYAYYKQDNPDLELNFMHKAKDAVVAHSGGYVIPDPDRALLELPGVQNGLVAITDRPGYGDFFINLASDLFKQPIGLMVYVKNSLGQPFGAGYIENAYISSHQMNVNAGANILVEACSLQFDRIKPVNVGVSTYIPAGA